MKNFLTFNFEFQSKYFLFPIRERIIERMFEHLSVIYLKTMAYNRLPWKITKNYLLELPSNTLGFKVGSFLQEHRFTLQKKAENHDVFHVLTSYSPNVKEEIGLQFLLFGNGKRSLFLLLALFSGVILLPEYIEFYKSSYQKGKSLRSFYQWNFEHLLQEDYHQLIEFINYKSNTLKPNI